MQAVRQPYRPVGQPDHLGGHQAVTLEAPGKQPGAGGAEIYRRVEVRPASPPHRPAHRKKLPLVSIGLQPPQLEPPPAARSARARAACPERE